MTTDNTDLVDWLSSLSEENTSELKAFVSLLLKHAELSHIPVLDMAPVLLSEITTAELPENRITKIFEILSYRIAREDMFFENDRIFLTDKGLAIFRQIKTLLNSPTSLSEAVSKKQADYIVTISPKGFVYLNEHYLLSKPHFDGENYAFIEFAVNHPNSKITRPQIIAAGYNKIAKDFRQIITDLGFIGELQNLFFPKISLHATEFRNYVSSEQLPNFEVDTKKLKSQISKLKKIK